MDQSSAIGFVVLALLAIGLRIASDVMYYHFGAYRNTDYEGNYITLAVAFDVLSYIALLGGVSVFINAFFIPAYVPR